MDKKQPNLEKKSDLGIEVKPQGRSARANLSIAREEVESPMENLLTMEAICERNNLKRALKRVEANKGAPGIDGMEVDDLGKYLKEHWLEIKGQLMAGTYRPHPVRRVEIPKRDTNGKRKLGIPSVVDRFIQQAMLQVLQKEWDQHFSEYSYGFRPGRRAHEAVSRAQAYLREGYSWIVDIDLEEFFDRVNHDRLISRLSKRIKDKRVIRVIRAYLNAGIMDGGLLKPTEAGTPQGGPLSPLLSNIVLDELDKELERRGHRFVRYADDCNIYVKSQRAGERVMASIRSYIERRLKLKVNARKSAVGEGQERKFLGFSFTSMRAGHRRRLAKESLERFKAAIRKLTSRNWGISMELRIEKLSSYLRGWKGYFGYIETSRVFRDLDSWIRHRLRSVYWKQWKTFQRRKQELRKRGVSRILAVTTAMSSKGPWRISHTPGVRIALQNSYFDSLGLPRLSAG